MVEGEEEEVEEEKEEVEGWVCGMKLTLVWRN